MCKNSKKQFGTFTDPRDGKVYKTVKIGNQVWLAENLAYEEPNSRCYDNNPANCAKYGKLYDWNTAIKSCPSGWHLPSEKEWRTLVNIFTGHEDEDPEAEPDEDYEFAAFGNNDEFFVQPQGGFGDFLGNFYKIDCECRWWSADASNENYATYQSYGPDGVWCRYMNEAGKSLLMSVRCVKNN